MINFELGTQREGFPEKVVFKKRSEKHECFQNSSKQRREKKGRNMVNNIKSNSNNPVCVK